MKIQHHEALRVPHGWTGQDKALVIQLERVLDELFQLLGIQKETTVTDVSYDSDEKRITVTMNGKTSVVVTVGTIKSALGSFTWGEIAGQ